MLLLAPAQIVTGVILYRHVVDWTAVDSQTALLVSLAHTALAYLFAAFVIGHIYLATTGDTPTEHFKMMITGKKARHH